MSGNFTVKDRACNERLVLILSDIFSGLFVDHLVSVIVKEHSIICTCKCNAMSDWIMS